MPPNPAFQADVSAARPFVGFFIGYVHAAEPPLNLVLGVHPRRDYRSQLAARNEGLRYVDESGAYRFNLVRNGDVWTVAVPPTKEPELSPTKLSADGEDEEPCESLNLLVAHLVAWRLAKELQGAICSSQRRLTTRSTGPAGIQLLVRVQRWPRAG